MVEYKASNSGGGSIGKLWNPFDLSSILSGTSSGTKTYKTPTVTGYNPKGTPTSTAGTTISSGDSSNVTSEANLSGYTPTEKSTSPTNTEAEKSATGTSPNTAGTNNTNNATNEQTNAGYSQATSQPYTTTDTSVNRTNAANAGTSNVNNPEAEAIIDSPIQNQVYNNAASTGMTFGTSDEREKCAITKPLYWRKRHEI